MIPILVGQSSVAICCCCYISHRRNPSPPQRTLGVRTSHSSAPCSASAAITATATATATAVGTRTWSPSIRRRRSRPGRSGCWETGDSSGKNEPNVCRFSKPRKTKQKTNNCLVGVVQTAAPLLPLAGGPPPAAGLRRPLPPRRLRLRAERPAGHGPGRRDGGVPLRQQVRGGRRARRRRLLGRARGTLTFFFPLRVLFFLDSGSSISPIKCTMYVHSVLYIPIIDQIVLLFVLAVQVPSSLPPP